VFFLSELDANKASGPDEIPPFVLKHYAEEISPVLLSLQNLFPQAYYHQIGKKQTFVQYLRKEGSCTVITGLCHLHQFVPRQWNILYSIIL